MKIGELIKEWRTAKGLNVRAAAKLIGVSHGTLSRIERGEKVDGVTMIKLIIWAFK
jgi:transcriptional regulator with XRE-family HTH domain